MAVPGNRLLVKLHMQPRDVGPARSLQGSAHKVCLHAPELIRVMQQTAKSVAKGVDPPHREGRALTV